MFASELNDAESKVGLCYALVTGATGVIGLEIFSYLIKSKLYKSGLLNIDLVCRFPTEEEIHRFEADRVRLIRQDLANEHFRLPNSTYRYIFHCAGYGQPAKFIQDPVSIYNINTSVVSLLLNHIESTGYFLLISTSEVYGESSFENTSETSDIVLKFNSVRNDYIIAKLASENILRNFMSRNPGVSGLAARVALAYGGGFKNSDSRVMYQLFVKAASERVIKLLDDGSALRTYLYVSDCVTIMMNALFDKSRRFIVLNVAGHETVSILELAGFIARLYNCEVISGHPKNALSNSPSRVKIDTSLSTKYLPNSPLVTLDEGLLIVKRWVDEHICQ